MTKLLPFMLDLLDAILGVGAHPDQLLLLFASSLFLLRRRDVGIGGTT